MGTDPSKGDLKSIPQYPSFKQVGIEDASTIVDFTSKFPPYSDFCFSNLLNWGKKSAETKYTFLHNNLVLKIRDNRGNRMKTSILGTNDIDQTLGEILKSVKELVYVPETTAKGITPDGGYEVIEDRDNFDYMYNLQSVLELKGQRYYSKRREIKKFLEAFPECTISHIDLNDSHTRKQVLALYDDWVELKDFKKKNEYEIELDSLNNYLSNYTHKDSNINVGLFLGNSLVAFSFNEIVHSNFAINFFSKANYTYSGVYSYMFYKVGEILCSRGITHLNFDADLGLENLRETKLRWHPEFFLKKYSILTSK